MAAPFYSFRRRIFGQNPGFLAAKGMKWRPHSFRGIEQGEINERLNASIDFDGICSRLLKQAVREVIARVGKVFADRQEQLDIDIASLL